MRSLGSRRNPSFGNLHGGERRSVRTKATPGGIVLPRRQVPFAHTLLVAVAAGPFHVAHQPLRDPLDVSPGEAKYLHALIEQMGRIRPSRRKILELWTDHPKVLGDPLELLRVDRVELTAVAPPVAQMRQEMIDSGERTSRRLAFVRV